MPAALVTFGVASLVLWRFEVKRVRRATKEEPPVRVFLHHREKRKKVDHYGSVSYSYWLHVDRLDTDERQAVEVTEDEYSPHTRGHQGVMTDTAETNVATFKGEIQADDVPQPVMALAVRLTLGKWAKSPPRTGHWETPRDPD